MKKNLILALVATSAILSTVQSAHAVGTEKGGKTPEGKARDVRVSRDQAAKSAGQGADGASTSIIASLRAAKLTLDGMQETSLGRVVSKDPVAEAALKDTIVQAKSERTFEFAKARVEALSNLKDVKTGLAAEAIANLTADGKAEQAYVTLALNSGKADGWPEGTLSNLTFLLVKANEAVRGGKSIADGMREAQTIIAQPRLPNDHGGRSIRLNLEDINKFCK